MNNFDSIDRRIQSKIDAIDQGIKARIDKISSHIGNSCQSNISSQKSQNLINFGAKSSQLNFNSQFLNNSQSIRSLQHFSKELITIPSRHFTQDILPNIGARPRCYAVIVGVSKYKNNRANPLRGCTIDASNIYSILIKQGHWDQNLIFGFINADATVKNVRTTIQEIAKCACPNDTFFFYQSSHGGSNGSHECICLYDENYYEEELALDLSRFNSKVNVVCVIDACHSGGLFSQSISSFSRKVNSALHSQSIIDGAKSGDELKIGWITAASETESSYERPDASIRGGEFTFALCDGIREGSAMGLKYRENDDGCIDLYEAFKYAKAVSGISEGDVIIDGCESLKMTPQCENKEICKKIKFKISSGV